MTTVFVTLFLPTFGVFDVEFSSMLATWMHHSQLFDSRSHILFVFILSFFLLGGVKFGININ